MKRSPKVWVRWVLALGLALGGASVAVGCGDAEAGEDGDAGDASAGSDAGVPSDGAVVADGGGGADGGLAGAVVAYLRGIYFVPDRSDVSTYPVSEVTWSVIGDRATLAYNLPRMLVGQSERVALSGPLSSDGTSATLSGPLGTATCTLMSSGVLLSCTEHFVGLEVDLAGVMDQAMRDDPANVDARVAVSTRFSGDPIGVLETDEYLAEPTPTRTCTTTAECDPNTVCDVELPPEIGFCEAHGTAAVGGACTASFECAIDLECEVDFGATSGSCQPHGG